jgi:hypothetical protein
MVMYFHGSINLFILSGKFIAIIATGQEVHTSRWRVLVSLGRAINVSKGMLKGLHHEAGKVRLYSVPVRAQVGRTLPQDKDLVGSPDGTE